MKRRTKFIAAGAAAAAIGVGASAGIATASGGDDSRPISGSDLSRASAAALGHTGGGRVTGTETGDEESYYQVEVTRDDGSQVDVQLDRSFAVVGAKADRESSSDSSGG